MFATPIYHFRVLVSLAKMNTFDKMELMMMEGYVTVMMIFVTKRYPPLNQNQVRPATQLAQRNVRIWMIFMA